MSETSPSPQKSGGEQGNLGVRIGFTTVALAVVVAHLLWPDLNIDAVTVGLLIIALLPWASSFIQSVEALGVKAELRKQEQRIEEVTEEFKQEVKGAAASVNRRVDFAEQYSAVASKAVEATLSVRSSDADQTLAELAQEYNAVRDSMRSGRERTTKMTVLVSKMVAYAPNLTDFDVKEALKAEDPGSRLAAYAYLYARPAFEPLEALVSSVTREDKPFNEYWGIRAIDKVLADRPPDANIDMTITKLRKYLNCKLPPGSDRYYELYRILRENEQ
jgi:hypothetical protein